MGEVEREEATGEDLVVVNMDVDEVGTGEEEGEEEVEKREASQLGVREEEPGEEGDEVARSPGSPGRPSTSTAW